MDVEAIKLESLDDELQSQILGKLNFMSDILTGKIEAPPGITIDQRPRRIDKLMKAVQSHIQSTDDEKSHNMVNPQTSENDQIEETSSTLYDCDPPTKIPPPLFSESALKHLSSRNQHDSNPTKYPLSNEHIVNLQHDGYVIIDDFISDQGLIKKVQSEIDSMQKSGKMKRAGLRRLNESDLVNLEITGFGASEINGIYEKSKSLNSLKSHFRIFGDIGYVREDRYFMIQIETTPKLALFVDSTNGKESKSCWIICAVSDEVSFPIIYYVGSGHKVSDVSESEIESEITWQCIGGVAPIGSVNKTNKWISSEVRNDLHCWLHSDDKHLAPSLKRCIISMDEIRVQLNKCLEFGSNTTQVQATLYPWNGSRYRTHIDDPPHIIKKNKRGKRKITCLLYFNVFEGDWSKETHGGCLRMHFGDGKQKDIEPLGGRLVVFNSQWLPHQVMPSYFDRYAVTLWMY